MASSGSSYFLQPYDAFCYAQAWNFKVSKHQSCYLRLQVLSHSYVLLNTLNLHSGDQSNSSVGKSTYCHAY